MKKITLLFILGILLTLIIGCTYAPDSTTPQIQDNTQKISNMQSTLSNLDSRIKQLEANQLTAEDILAMAQINKVNKTYTDTSSVTQGCPSEHDVNVKWFDALGKGDITQSQYDKILKKYNSEGCQ